MNDEFIEEQRKIHEGIINKVTSGADDTPDAGVTATGPVVGHSDVEPDPLDGVGPLDTAIHDLFEYKLWLGASEAAASHNPELDEALAEWLGQGLETSAAPTDNQVQDLEALAAPTDNQVQNAEVAAITRHRRCRRYPPTANTTKVPKIETMTPSRLSNFYNDDGGPDSPTFHEPNAPSLPRQPGYI